MVRVVVRVVVVGGGGDGAVGDAGDVAVCGESVGAGYYGATGAVRIALTGNYNQRPPNDDFGYAQGLVSRVSATGSTVLATRETNEPVFGVNPSASIWYWFTPTVSGSVTVRGGGAGVLQHGVGEGGVVGSGGGCRETEAGWGGWNNSGSSTGRVWLLCTPQEGPTASCSSPHTGTTHPVPLSLTPPSLSV